MRSLLLTSALAIFLLSPLMASSTSRVIVNSDVVGPYKRYQEDTNITFSYQYYGKSSEVMNEVVSYILVSTGRVYYKQSYESHTVRNGEIYSFTFPMKLRNSFNDDGARILIEIKASSISIFTAEGLVKPYTNIDSEKLISNGQTHFSTEGFSFCIKDSELIQLDDDINFNLNFMNFVHDYYRYLDVSRIGFSYNNSKFNYESAYLTFDDYDYTFPFMEHDINNQIRIDLNLSIYNKNVGARLKSKYYVNPISLDMSEIYREGFISAPYFYLPKNMKDRLNTSNFTLHLAGLGNSKMNLKCIMKYTCNRSIFGPCMSSDYCVLGDYF